MGDGYPPLPPSVRCYSIVDKPTHLVFLSGGQSTSTHLYIIQTEYLDRIFYVQKPSIKSVIVSYINQLFNQSVQ